MNPIKISRKLNKKWAAKALLFLYVFSMAGYGTYAGAINAYNWSVIQVDKFAVSRAVGRDLIDAKVITEQVPVIDPVLANEVKDAVSNAAKEGAKAGSDESIRANLGK